MSDLVGNTEDRFCGDKAYLSHVVRKPAFCICENRDADQLRYKDSTIPPLSKSEISSLLPSFLALQPGLCRTRSETRTLVF